MLHNPVEDAIRIDGDIIILEGNYLLLDEDGWRELHNYADYTISIKAEEELLRKRLIDRRMKTGVGEDAATRFVDYSDMPNVRLCLTKTMPSDLQFSIASNGEYT
jgi:pantothenate kinase